MLIKKPQPKTIVSSLFKEKAGAYRTLSSAIIQIEIGQVPEHLEISLEIPSINETVPVWIYPALPTPLGQS